MFCCSPFLRVVFTPAYPELLDFAKRNFLPQHPLRHSPLWLESRDFKWNRDFFRGANLESPLFIDPTAHDPFHSPYSPLFHQFHLRPPKNPSHCRSEKEGKNGEEQRQRALPQDDSACITSRGPTRLPRHPNGREGGGAPRRHSHTTPTGSSSSSAPPPSVDAVCGEEHVRTMLYDAMREKHRGEHYQSYPSSYSSSSPYASTKDRFSSPHHATRYETHPQDDLFVPVCTMPTYQSFYVHNADEVMLRDGGIGPSKITFLQHVLQLRHLQFRDPRVHWDSVGALDQELAMAHASLKYSESTPKGNKRVVIKGEEEDDEEEEEEGGGGDMRGGLPFSKVGSQKNALWSQTFAPPAEGIACSASSSFSSGMAHFFPSDTSGIPFNAKTGFAFTGSAATTLLQAQHEKGFTSRWWATSLQWKELGCEVVGAGGVPHATSKRWKKFYGQRVQFPVLSKLVHISLVKHPFEILRRSFIDSRTRLLRCVSLTEVELFHEYESLRFQEGGRGEEGEYENVLDSCAPERGIMRNASSLSSSSSSLASEAFLNRLSPEQYLSISILQDMRARHEKLLSRRRVVKAGEDPLFPTWQTLFPTRASTDGETNLKRHRKQEKDDPPKNKKKEKEEATRETTDDSQKRNSLSTTTTATSRTSNGTIRGGDAEEDHQKTTRAVRRPSQMNPATRVPTTPRYLVIFEKEDIEVFLPLYISSVVVRRQGLRLREDEHHLVTPAVYAAPPLIPSSIEILRGTTTHQLLSASSAPSSAFASSSSSFFSPSSSYPFSSYRAPPISFHLRNEPMAVRYFYHLRDVHVSSSSSSSSMSTTSTECPPSFPLPPEIWPRLLECKDPSIPWNGITGERLPFVELEREAVRKRMPELVDPWDKLPHAPDENGVLQRWSSGGWGVAPRSAHPKPGDRVANTTTSTTPTTTSPLLAATVEVDLLPPEETEKERTKKKKQKGGKEEEKTTTKKEPRKKRSTEATPLQNEVSKPKDVGSDGNLLLSAPQEDGNTSPSPTFLSLLQRSIWLESTDVLQLGGAVDANVAPIEVQENSEANAKRRRAIAWEEKTEMALQKAKEEKELEKVPSFHPTRESTDLPPTHPLLYVEQEKARHRRSTSTSPTASTFSSSFSTPSSATACESLMEQKETYDFLTTSRGINEDEEKGFYHISALWDVYDYLSRI